jgi:hypothetical protein
LHEVSSVRGSSSSSITDGSAAIAATPASSYTEAYEHDDHDDDYKGIVEIKEKSREGIIIEPTRLITGGGGGGRGGGVINNHHHDYMSRIIRKAPGILDTKALSSSIILAESDYQGDSEYLAADANKGASHHDHHQTKRKSATRKSISMLKPSSRFSLRNI